MNYAAIIAGIVGLVLGIVVGVMGFAVMSFRVFEEREVQLKALKERFDDMDAEFGRVQTAHNAAKVRLDEFMKGSYATQPHR